MVDWLYLKFWIPKAQLPWWNEKRKTRQHLYWWWAHISFGSNTRKKTMTCECKCDVTHEFAVEYIKKAHTKTENKHEIKSILHKVASMKSSKNSNEIVLHVFIFFIFGLIMKTAIGFIFNWLIQFEVYFAHFCLNGSIDWKCVRTFW